MLPIDIEQRQDEPRLRYLTTINYHPDGLVVSPRQKIDPDVARCLIQENQEQYPFSREEMVAAIVQTFGIKVPPSGCGNEQNEGMIDADKLVTIIRSAFGVETNETTPNGRGILYMTDNDSYYLQTEPYIEKPGFTAIYSVIYPDQDRFKAGDPVVVETAYPSGVSPSNIYDVFIPLTDPETGHKVIGLVVIYFYENRGALRNSPFSVSAWIKTTDDNIPQQINLRDIIALDENFAAYDYIESIDYWPRRRRMEVNNNKQEPGKTVTRSSNRNFKGREGNNTHNKNPNKGLLTQERNNGRFKELNAKTPTRRRWRNRTKIPQRRK